MVAKQSPKLVPQRRWLTCSVAIAVSFTWAAEDVIFIPAVQEMGVSEFLSSAVFASNAILGLCISPHVAAWSDRRKQRHPLLLAGGMGAAVALTALSMCRVAPWPTLRVVAFFLLAGAAEFCVDLMLIAGRSLACDHATGEMELEAANSVFGLSINLGRLLGLIAGSVPLEHLFATGYRDAFIMLTVAMLAACTAVSVISTPDVARSAGAPQESQAKQPLAAPAISTCSLTAIPRCVWFWLLQSVLAWTAIVGQGMYFTSTTFVVSGQQLVGGILRPHQLAMAAQSASAIATSMLLPFLNRHFGTGLVNDVALLGYCVFLMCLRHIRDIWTLIALMACSGVSCAVIDCNPYVLCESAIESDENRGRMIALLDNTMNVAQLGCALALGPGLQLLGSDHGLLFAVVGALCGASMMVAVALRQSVPHAKAA